MAKKKRSAALFEVMVKQEQRRLPRPPGMFRTLYLWFKNRPRNAPVSVPAMTVARDEYSAPATVEPPPPPVMREIKYVPPPEPEPQPTYDEPSHETITVNRAGGQVAMRISYGTVIVSALALATVVLSAFLIGKKWQNRPQTVLTNTTTPELRRQPPRANLTDVRRVSVPPTVQYNPDPPDILANNAAATGTNAAGNAPTRSKERQVGLNYVLMQSYADEKLAQQAATILIQNGIDATVEKGIPGFLKYSVVGQIGFSRISSNPQLEAYLTKIRTISELNIKKGSYMALKPQPFKWQAWPKRAD
jgi:hypothetical protein